jgi:hypothetical protein
MKRAIIVFGIFSMLTVIVGCNSKTPVINVGADLAERLPEDQRNIVLDEALAEIRSQRYVKQLPDGFTFSGSIGPIVTDKIPGQSKNIPSHILTEEAYVQIFKAINDYFKKNGMSALDFEETMLWNCIDPRINAIYDDEDKGVATGYENENILLKEYETNNKYRYIILVRESTSAPWEVIHEGTSYKQ